MGKVDLSAWYWIQANTPWMMVALVAWLLVQLAAVLWMFWRNRKRPLPPTHPLDEAMMELPDDFAAMWVGQPSRNQSVARVDSQADEPGR